MSKPFYQWTGQEILECLRKQDRRTRFRIIFGSAAGLFFAVFLVWPAWISRPQQTAQARAIRTQIQLAKVQIHQEPALFRQRKEEEDFIRGIHGNLLKEGESEKIVGILASLAEKSRVSLLGTEPLIEDQQGAEQNQSLPAPFNSDYRRITYLVTLEGGYHPLAEFVSNLENHPKIFRIEELSIVGREETPKVHLAQVMVSAFGLAEGKKEAET